MYSVRILDRSRQTLAVFHADVRWYFNRRINEAGQMTIWIPREEASQWPMFTENKGSYAQMAYYVQIYKDTTLKATGKITGRDFTEEHLVVQALTEEVLLENIVCPAQYGMVWDNQDIADVARDLLDNWYAARVKDQTEWEECVESENIDTTVEPGVVMLAKDDAGAYLPSGYIVLHFNQKDIADFYLGAPLGEHETSPFKSWGRIRWASDNGGEVKTTMQYSDDGETWSEEIEGAFPDQVGVDPGWTDEEEDVYVRINLYTSDTTSEDDEGNPVGQTPFVFAVEMLARVSSDILSSSIPLETGMTVKGLVADGENALAILREACENVHAGPAGMTGSEKYEFYVQNGVLYLVSEIGSDQTDECVFRAGTNTEINKLSDDDEKLCNVLLARGKGDGINRLQKEFRDYDSIAEYGEYRKVVDFDVDDITDLTTKAEAYLEEFATPVVAFSIQTMFPINAEPSYGLGDYVRVVDPKTGVVSTVRIMQETREYTDNGLAVQLQLGRPAVTLNDAIGYEPPVRKVETFTPQGVWARGVVLGLLVGFNKPKNPNWETTEVHISTSKGFTVSASTLAKSGKQNKFEILELEGGTRYYVKLINIDSFGNRSSESGEVSAVAQMLDVGDIGDGVAPATPTGLDLSTFFSGGKTYVKATWNANSETDIKGYEVAWSYDNVTYYNLGLTTELSMTTETKSGVTVYMKVRAKDIEGYESAWSSADSITSASDSTVPDNASSINATGGFDLIYVYWAHSKPSDFSYYVLQRAPDPYSSWTEIAVVQSKEFIDKNVVADTYYKYRVKAYDVYGNGSASWATTSSGVTCSSVESELSDLAGELSTLDGELEDLDEALAGLTFADIGGTITTIQIGDDTISAPKLKANSVEAAKIAASAVTAEKIYAGAVTTEKIYAGAVTTEKLYAGAVVAAKIATDAIEANHIKAGEISANKLNAVLELSVGRIIQVGADVQLGKGVGPTGLTGDGIYVSDDGYFRINSGLFMDEGLWMGKSSGERIHPYMTANTTPAGYEVSNSASSSLAWYVFRESISTYINHAADAWSQIELPTRKILASYNIYSYSDSNYATAWKMQGSNDGTNWTDLDTQSGISGWAGWYGTDFEISDPAAFLYYRLLVTAIAGTGARIGSIELFDAAGWKFSVVGTGSDPNFFAWDGQLNLKGNLILATDENVIEFEDSKIELGDGSVSSGEGFVYFQRGSTGEHIAWLSEYLIEAAERNSFGVLADEYATGFFSINIMASDTVEDNNKAYLKAELRNTSSANTMTALMEIIRLGSGSTYGYFKFSHPINVLYATGQEADDMSNGTVLVQGDYLFYRDSSGTWKRAATYNASPS